MEELTYQVKASDLEAILESLENIMGPRVEYHPDINVMQDRVIKHNITTAALVYARLLNVRNP